MQSETQRLRDLCSLIVDCPHSTPLWTESGYIVIRNQNIKGGRLDLSSPSFTDAEHFAHRIRRAKPTAGDIIFTREAPMGEVCMVPPKLECCVGQRQVLLRPNPKVVDGRFLLYALQSPQVQHEISWSEGTGSTVSNVRIPVLEALRIPTPDLTTQQEIGAVLGMLDDRIDLLRQTNATLESIAQALFKSWFIDFDPVRAKAEGHEPEGMDAAMAALFPAELEESALGLIPQGWRVGSVYEVASVIYGAPFASKQFNTDANGQPLVRIRDLRDEAPGVWTQEVHPKGYLLRPGDIVVGMDGEFRAYLWGGVSAWMNQRVCCFQPVAPHCAAFVRCAIAGPLAHIEATEVATTVIHLGKGDIDRFKVVVPPDAVASAFANLADPLYARIINNKVQSRHLSALRDALLPRLISGKLRLPEAQQQVEDALA